MTGSEASTHDVDLNGEFSALFESECAYVVHTLRRFGVREADAPDVAHEVFLVALRNFAACDRTRPMRPWLGGIAFRVASDYRKRAHLRREVQDDEMEVRDDSILQDEVLQMRQRQELVRKALEAIDLDRRAVFVLHDIDGVSMPEIAEALEIPLNTGYSRLRLARSEFTASVKRAMRGEHA